MKLYAERVGNLASGLIRKALALVPFPKPTNTQKTVTVVKYLVTCSGTTRDGHSIILQVFVPTNPSNTKEQENSIKSELGLTKCLLLNIQKTTLTITVPIHHPQSRTIKPTKPAMVIHKLQYMQLS